MYSIQDISIIARTDAVSVSALCCREDSTGPGGAGAALCPFHLSIGAQIAMACARGDLLTVAEIFWTNFKEGGKC